MTLSLEAYHGTSLQAARSIEATGYNESCSDSEWLGRGVYFFVEGISDPLEDAKDWAKAEAFDKMTRGYKYGEYCVLKSVVELDQDRVVDLTNHDGLRNFNALKNRFLSRIFKDYNVSLKMMGSQQNCALFNYIVATIRAHAVKHHLYIKNSSERQLQLKLNVPNSTVLCVRKSAFAFNAVKVCEGKTNE